MPDKARKEIVRQGEIGTYHCWKTVDAGSDLSGRPATTDSAQKDRRVARRSAAWDVAVDSGSPHRRCHHPTVPHLRCHPVLPPILIIAGVPLADKHPRRPVPVSDPYRWSACR